jgi:hypothetical protein
MLKALALSLLALVLSLAREAEASQQVVTFLADKDSAPGYACAAFLTKADNASIDEWNAALYFQNQESASGRGWVALENRFPTASVGGKEGQKRLEAAWQVLQGNGTNVCSGPVCKPRFNLPSLSEDTRLALGCTKLEGDSQRVVLVAVEVERVQLTLSEVRGAQQSLIFSSKETIERGSIGAFQVRVLGGSYLPTEPLRGNARDELRIRLTPRCSTRQVALPPIRTENETLLVLSHFMVKDAEGTWSEQTGRYSPTSGRSFSACVAEDRIDSAKLVGEIYSTEEGGLKRLAGWLATWPGGVPPASLDTQFSDFTFRWRRNCFVHKGCPEVGLRGTQSASCARDERNTDANVCAYSCTQGSVTLPTGVKFTHRVQANGRELWPVAWSDELAYASEELSGYVPPADRVVDLDFSRWVSEARDHGKHRKRRWRKTIPEPKKQELKLRSFVKRSGASVQSVLMTRPDGTAVFVKPKEVHQRLPTPGLECGDSLVYRIAGERDHDSGTVAVDDGRLSLDPPRATMTRVELSLALGFGFRTANDGGYTANGRGFRSGAWWPFGAGRFGVDVRPWSWPGALSFSFTGTVGTRPYFPLVDANTEKRVADTVLYNHLLVGAGLLVPLFATSSAGSWMFGVGLLGGARYAFDDDDSDKVGNTAPTAGIYLAMRMPLARRTYLELNIHSLFFEQVRYYETDFFGMPVEHEFSPVFFGGDLGLRFGL